MTSSPKTFSLLDCPIGFDDGVISGYDMRDSILSVNVVAWNESTLTIRFSGVLYFQDRGGRQLSRVMEVVETSSLVLSALRYHFTSPPHPIQHRHFQFVDLDDVPVLEVVAVECRVAIDAQFGEEENNGAMHP